MGEWFMFRKQSKYRSVAIILASASAVLTLSACGGDRVASSAKRFVNACEKHEIGASKAECQCVANYMVQNAPEDIVVGTFKFMADKYPTRLSDEELFDLLLNKHLPKYSEPDQITLLDAMAMGSMTCFPE